MTTTTTAATTTTPLVDPTTTDASTVTEAATANFVYLRSAKHAWIPAKVVDQPDNNDHDETVLTVRIPVYKNEQLIVSDGGRTALRFRKETIRLAEYTNQALPLQNVDEHGKLLVVEDMVDLAFLHEVRTCVCRVPRGKEWNSIVDIVY